MASDVQERSIHRVHKVVNKMYNFAVGRDTEEVSNLETLYPPTISVGGQKTGQYLNFMLEALDDFIDAVDTQLPFARWERAVSLRENGKDTVIKSVKLFLDKHPDLNQAQCDKMEKRLDKYQVRIDDMVDAFNVGRISPVCANPKLVSVCDSAYKLYKLTGATYAIRVPNPDSIIVGGMFTSISLAEFLEDVFDFSKTPEHQNLVYAQALCTSGETKVVENVQNFIDFYKGDVDMQAVQTALDAYKLEIDALVAAYE